MSKIQFLDSAGLSYLWGKIKDNFANQLKYENGELYLVDGLGEKLETTVDTRKFGAIAVDDYASLISYAKAEYVGLTLYLRSNVSDGALENPKTYETGAYVVTGDNGLLRLAVSTASGDINDAIVILDGRISTLEDKLSGVDFDSFASKDSVNDLSTEFNDIIANYALKNVASGDKLLTLSTEGILSSTLTFGVDDMPREDGKKYIYINGNDGEEIGKVDISNFVIDGMLDSVKWSTDNNNVLVMSFNTDAGKQDIEVDFGKYVDVYSAGDGLKLDSNTKTFSIDTSDTSPLSQYIKSNISDNITSIVDKSTSLYMSTSTSSLEVNTMTEADIDSVINSNN